MISSLLHHPPLWGKNFRKFKTKLSAFSKKPGFLQKSKYSFLQRFALALIGIYQKTLSFDHGPLRYRYPYGFCRFRPTCSEYAADAIQRYGLIRGVVKAFLRILRCNPFSRGGWDPA